MFFCNMVSEQLHQILLQVSVQFRLDVKFVLKTLKEENQNESEQRLMHVQGIKISCLKKECATYKVDEDGNDALQRGRVLCQSKVEVLD